MKVRHLTQKEIDAALASWDALWRFLTDCPEAHAAQLLDHERTHKRRKQFLLRVHSRLNYLRAHRERAELRELAA